MVEEILTIKKIAKHYNVRREVIFKRAARLGLGEKILGIWTFTEEERCKLAPGKRGNFRK